ncbi:Uncharacterised protein [Mycobacteroides abscessus subsp. abscessus]|uniref:Uncharacterized protein n=1 Tax=Mycobacteroides abscessus subsp. massiliense TaxID=1962118 RepID=A0A1T8TRY1_9MYCO|nr:hypothetical protein [Mycobacteroides abscessus]SIE91156.1 Uncharacterised protein [Mycobacteroides abscessus subsp. abscessus]SKM83271.1 Uncharacterised protein [Mycobacteroides abscessus subsp. massiliense]SIF35677.1 Uncharacterised protein [Mycobacteroides abscessus subsp. abscessus]SIF40963.1 Uncharacterised protein [Mycobacteroides abscessus subsp. abscessus]
MNDGALTITLSFAGALMLIVGLGLDDRLHPHLSVGAW